MSCRSFLSSSHSVVLVRLGPVANKLETADDFANGEESNNLGDNYAHRVPLCAGRVPDLCKDVGGLLGGAVGLAGHTAEERAGVAESVQGGLDVVLHSLDGSRKVRNCSGVLLCPVVLLEGLRWLHASLVGNKLAELKSDPSVVGSLGNQSWNNVSMQFSLEYSTALRLAGDRVSRSNHADMAALDKPCRALWTCQCTRHFSLLAHTTTRNPHIAN
jgi:hypothetical protein